MGQRRQRRRPDEVYLKESALNPGSCTIGEQSEGDDGKRGQRIRGKDLKRDGDRDGQRGSLDVRRDHQRSNA